ncbi:TolC family protein [Dyadobacter fanqingshengii]|uniref:Efflux transporter outer membrane subunit n=1 Tax=Dyadobacter fanqingshengii TaxID=2906443 RepID=A0A9X1T8J2_9BACT|nr:efflux transporter outer membrane subunit [Dyadobacter fanqingshengii]MCF0039711.1 efflux transporter outer membrane subunit [Dyadobacter fanqingshengii]USJ38526.1 efflux transporter outer membrane subunit [Dyadobacter fanqingshengii]
MKRSITTLLFLIVLVASSCRISRDTPKTTAVLPDHFHDQPDDTTSIADLPWDAFFIDTTLQKLIGSAIEKNYDMQIALKNIEAAQLISAQVRHNYLPQASLQISANSARPSDNSLNGLSLDKFLGTSHIEDYGAVLNLSWEADIWGKIRNQQKAALAGYLQSKEARNAVQTYIVSSVTKGFYNLLMLDAQLSIARKNVTLNDSTLEMITLQFNAGQVSSLAVQQAQAQQQLATQLIPQFEQAIHIQENALKILAGELPGRIDRYQAFDQLALPEKLSAGIPSQMISRRPDVKSRELELVTASANIGITKANMYPALRITASGGVNSFLASNWFNIPASLFGVIAGGVVQPVFQQKRLRTQYEVAQVEQRRAVAEFRKSVLDAIGETSDALVRIDKLKEQENIAQLRSQNLRQATQNARMLFQNGMATYLEVITAQGNVLQSELSLTSIKRDQFHAVTDLYTALGGGWK